MRIELAGVGKRYRLEWVLRGIDLQLQAGGRYAVTGPNGSGKSTLLRLVSGHLTPSRGRILHYLGEAKLAPGQVYRHLSYAAPYIELIEEFTLEESLRFHQRFKPFGGGMQPADLIDLLQLGAARHKPLRHFSSGMKQRLKLALALCSRSKLVLLDEPTTNLDQQGVDWYRSLIDRFAADRLLVVASNVPVDYAFCREEINILDYKKKRS